MKDLEPLLREKEKIEAKIKEQLQYIKHKKIQEAASHLINAGGKRIRPALLVLAYKTLGGKDVNKAIAVSASIELLHNWTLIHDDIIDRSETRRNVQTVHKKWDETTALLAGDALSNLLYLSLVKNKVDKKILPKIIETISETSLELIDGETMDVDFEKRTDLTEQEYFDMVKKKTGALIKSSVKIGAMLATQDKEKIKALETYGELIGITFQIQDDLLDLTGDQMELGKDIGRDIKEGKRTLIVIHALNNANQKDAKLLIRILSNKSPSEQEIKEAINIIKKSGSIDYVQRTLLDLTKEAKEAINILPETENKIALLALADYIINRRK